MPIIKSAIKKVRQDEKRRITNAGKLARVRTLIKRAGTEKTFVAVSDAYSAIDKAVKINLINKGFAGRSKAALSKFAKPTKLSEIKVKTSKKVARKTVTKLASDKTKR